MSEFAQGAAWMRLLAALGDHGRAVRPVGYRALARCPGVGHWRGDENPSLIITPDRGRVLVFCRAGCNTEDLLGVIGLTMGDLYDDPVRERPKYNPLRRAIGKAAGFTLSEKTPLLWLLGKARGTDVLIPVEHQPRSLVALTAELRPATKAMLLDAFAHWDYHGWLSRPCMIPDCGRDGQHPGRGHRPWYVLDMGEDCPGAGCPCRKKRPPPEPKRSAP
jgi:hypothetical protein